MRFWFPLTFLNSKSLIEGTDRETLMSLAPPLHKEYKPRILRLYQVCFLHLCRASFKLNRSKEKKLERMLLWTRAGSIQRIPQFLNNSRDFPESEIGVMKGTGHRQRNDESFAFRTLRRWRIVCFWTKEAFHQQPPVRVLGCQC